MTIVEKMKVDKKDLTTILCEGLDRFMSELAEHNIGWYGRGETIPREEIIKEYGSVKDIKAMFITKLFDITTYDGQLDFEFGRSIIEVMKAIQKRKNFDYIKNKKKYQKYILVANLLSNNGWLEWGTSIRGAWFDAYGSAEFPNGVYYELEGEFPIDNPYGGDSKNINILLEFLTNDKY